MNDDPMFLEMMADEVLKTWDRYRTGVPLGLAIDCGQAVGARPPSARLPIARRRPEGQRVKRRERE